MRGFINTGFYLPTLTTFDDPKLKVFEMDNGITWTFKFYVEERLIDCINMEYTWYNINYCIDFCEFHKEILKLPVYDAYDNNFIGYLGERLNKIREEMQEKNLKYGITYEEGVF